MGQFIAGNIVPEVSRPADINRPRAILELTVRWSVPLIGRPVIVGVMRPGSEFPDVFRDLAYKTIMQITRQHKHGLRQSVKRIDQHFPFIVWCVRPQVRPLHRLFYLRFS